MRYVLVISSLTAGGAERVLSGLSNRWAQQGHCVSIISFKRLPAFYPLDEHVECVWLPESPTPWLRWVFFLLKIIMFRYHVWRLRPERVLSFLDKTNILTLFMLWRQGIPVVVSERIDPRKYYIHPLWRWLRRKLYPTAQHVVVQTPDIASYFDFPTVIIPNPVPPAEEHAKIAPKATHWISIGRLDPQKDHMTLISAVHALLHRHPDIKLTIYGEGPERKRLEGAIKKLGLQGKVILPGLTNNVSDALRQSDLFIFPSLYEGFPNALCEAMAHGLPVIASDIPGNIDIIENGVNGRLFPTGSVQALADACEQIVDDLETRSSWGAAAAKSMEAYAPSIIGKAWDDVMTS